MGSLGGIMGQRGIVIAASSHRIQRQIELILPASIMAVGILLAQRAKSTVNLHNMTYQRNSNRAQLSSLSLMPALGCPFARSAACAAILYAITPCNKA
jgi:hypothetical protein